MTLQSDQAMKATRDQTKVHNSRLILRFIYNEGTVSRADLARKTSLTRTTVSTLVDALIAANWVIEGGFGPSIGGKPPMLLTFNKDAGCFACLDLSEKPFRGALVSLRGQLLLKIDQQNDKQIDTMDDVLCLTQQLVERAQIPVLGIGVGSQGIVDVKKGIIRQANRLNWQNIPLQQSLQERFDIPAYLLNDSDAAAFGEYAFGSHRDTQSLIMIQVGEGISAGILLNGNLFHGDGYGAGEISHNRAVSNGKPCHCGHTGCLQTVASSAAVIESARDVYRKEPASAISQLVADPGEITLSHIQAAVNQGDPYLRAVVQNAGGHIGRAAAQIVGLLNVQHIYFTGPVTVLGDVWLESIRKALSENCLETLAQQTTIAIRSQLDDLTLIGAAAYILRKQLGVV
jgi:N-acetylglucosamine repressor